jgi:hypothetical protein
LSLLELKAECSTDQKAVETLNFRIPLAYVGQGGKKFPPEGKRKNVNDFNKTSYLLRSIL